MYKMLDTHVCFKAAEGQAAEGHRGLTLFEKTA